jgi:Protein of unknown function (DUF1588)/Protein of unknown function (DUF1592)/Protein of unknown function (DUF1595)/Protein of unknown function (DUF1585)/Protein of unknown function (DUF1587)
MITLLVGSLLVGCAGCNEDEPASLGSAPAGVGPQGARRLSVDEIDNTLRDVLGDDTRPAATSLPADVIDPFDNALANQSATAILVAGVEALANDVATRLVADPARRDEVVGCVPTSATDEACLGAFVERVGRLLLRRALDSDEVDAYLALAALFTADGDFYAGVDVIVRALLQHPEFVYRVEIGAPTDEPGVFALTDLEVAARLSFLVWGSTPDDALLTEAEAERLSTPEQLAANAERLLADPRARDRADRIHSMWLGYWTLPHPIELTTAFRLETRLLLEEQLFDDPGPWLGLFTASGTYADDELAVYYGLPAPGSDEPTWVEYGDSGRQGLLSHGSFLSVNAKFGDTSPTLRGKLVRERLLCEPVPPPPPTVNVDEPPAGDGSSTCKVDRYAAHAAEGSCKACHDLVDPIGFGLENYDQLGLFREHDAGDPDCVISGEGNVDGAEFVGPAGLADQLSTDPRLAACAVQQLYTVAMGRTPTPDDTPYVDRLQAAFDATGEFDDLVYALVADPAFPYRREEEVSE